MVPVTSADFYQRMAQRNEVRAIAWATCHISTVIHRSNNELSSVEGSFCFYVHLIV